MNIEEEQGRLGAERAELEDEMDLLQEEIGNSEQTVKELERELEREDISRESREDKRSTLANAKQNIEDKEQRVRDIEDRFSEIEDEEMEVFNTFEFPRAPGLLQDFLYEISGGEFDLDNIDPIEYLEMPDRFERDLDRFEPSDEMVEVDEDLFLDRALDVFQREFDFDFEIGQSPGPNDSF